MTVAISQFPSLPVTRLTITKRLYEETKEPFRWSLTLGKHLSGMETLNVQALHQNRAD